jgi:Ca2+/Na+ antiporter
MRKVFVKSSIIFLLLCAVMLFSVQNVRAEICNPQTNETCELDYTCVNETCLANGCNNHLPDCTIRYYCERNNCVFNDSYLVTTPPCCEFSSSYMPEIIALVLGLILFIISVILGITIVSVMLSLLSSAMFFFAGANLIAFNWVVGTLICLLGLVSITICLVMSLSHKKQ